METTHGHTVHCRIWPRVFHHPSRTSCCTWLKRNRVPARLQNTPGFQWCLYAVTEKHRNGKGTSTRCSGALWCLNQDSSRFYNFGVFWRSVTFNKKWLEAELSPKTTAVPSSDQKQVQNIDYMEEPRGLAWNLILKKKGTRNNSPPEEPVYDNNAQVHTYNLCSDGVNFTQGYFYPLYSSGMFAKVCTPLLIWSNCALTFAAVVVLSSFHLARVHKLL